MILTPQQMVASVLAMMDEAVQPLSEDRREAVKAAMVDSLSQAMFQGPVEVTKGEE